jgi:hypothetical protein
LLDCLRQDGDPTAKYGLICNPVGDYNTGDMVFAISAIGECLHQLEGDVHTVAGLAGALKVSAVRLTAAIGEVRMEGHRRSLRGRAVSRPEARQAALALIRAGLTLIDVAAYLRCHPRAVLALLG